MVFFLYKSHYMSKSKLCVSIDVHFIFVQVFCMSNIKKLAKPLSKIHTGYNLQGSLEFLKCTKDSWGEAYCDTLVSISRLKNGNLEWHHMV